MFNCWNIRNKYKWNWKWSFPFFLECWNTLVHLHAIHYLHPCHSYYDCEGKKQTEGTYLHGQPYCRKYRRVWGYMPQRLWASYGRMGWSSLEWQQSSLQGSGQTCGSLVMTQLALSCLNRLHRRYPAERERNSADLFYLTTKIASTCIYICLYM